MDIIEEPDRTYKQLSSGNRVPVPDTEIVESEPPSNIRTHKLVRIYYLLVVYKD